MLKKKKKKLISRNFIIFAPNSNSFLLMNITDNFTLEEMCNSRTARINGIDNLSYNPSVIISLTTLCLKVLQPLRDHFAEPVIISSGYRCPALNRLVKGVYNSQHLLGQAADIYLDGDTKRESEYFRYIRDNLDYDQLILEGNQSTSWIHVSYVSHKKNRKKAWMQLQKTN